MKSNNRNYRNAERNRPLHCHSYVDAIAELSAIILSSKRDVCLTLFVTTTFSDCGELYRYAYGDKEAIFLRAFDQYAGQFLETAGSALAQGDAAARLKNFFDVRI